MKTVKGWLWFLSTVVRYVISRTGLVRRRNFTENVPQMLPVMETLFHWESRVRVLHPERCPAAGPAVFTANHHKLDDPIFLWPGIHAASAGRIVPGFMMRDDFFRGFPWDWSPVHPGDLCAMCGAVGISRDHVRAGQIRPFRDLLAGGGAFIMFPGRTRSRTGAWVEYREPHTSPGSPAFLAAQALRRNPDTPVALVPMGRTFHPVAGTSAIAFGEPLLLREVPDRETLRATDRELLRRTGELVEVHSVHLAAALLWTHCLHRGESALGVERTEGALRAWAGEGGHPLTHPELSGGAAAACDAALGFFGRHGMLRKRGGQILPVPERILSCPEWDTRYRRRNPVKYWLNQTMHLPGVGAWAERRVLR